MPGYSGRAPTGHPSKTAGDRNCLEGSPRGGPLLERVPIPSCSAERLESDILQLQVALAVRVRAGNTVVRGAARSLDLKVLLVPSRNPFWQGIPRVPCGLSRYKSVLGTTTFWWDARSATESRAPDTPVATDGRQDLRIRVADDIVRRTAHSSNQVRQASFDLPGRVSSCRGPGTV